MRQRELINVMDFDELTDWMAYDKSQDKDFNFKMKKEIQLEAQKDATAADEARLIRDLFRGLGG